MAQQTIEEARVQHEADTEANRALGVQDYKTGQKQSDQVWEVTDGKKYVPDPENPRKMRALGPGHLFHPTETEMQDDARALRGKAREVPASVLSGLQASGKVFAGTDVGLRALPMAESTVKLAGKAGLTEADFEGVEPEGSDGQYTYRQVEAMIEAAS